MNDEAAFLAALAARPDDVTLRLVFADWLDEHDDPRSAWLREPELYRWAGPTLADPLPALARELGKERTRHQVVGALRKLGPAALPVLVQSARNSDPKVRDHALEALEELGPAAAELLPDLLKWSTDPSGPMRARAVKSIGCLGAAAAGAVPLLIEYLEGSDDDVFVAAIEALGKIGPAAAAAIPHFAAAVERAGRIDDARDNYGSDSDKTAQPIIDAIGNMGPAALGALPILLNALCWYNYGVVGSAARILHGLGLQIVEPVLRTIPRMERECEHYGTGIVIHFGAAAVPFVLKALGAAKKKGAAQMRAGAVEVINAWHERPETRPPELVAAVPLLAKMLRKGNESAFYALAGFGADAKPAIPVLRAFAARKGDLYNSTSREALQLLKTLGEPVDEAADIRERLADANPLTRENAVCQLICRAEIPDEEKAALYALALKDDSPSVRTHAVRQASWQIRENPAALLALLREAATDPDAEVREAVAVALGDDRANAPDALPLLLALLADDAPNVRAKAAEGLGARGAGAPAVVKALRARLTDPDPAAFAAVVKALAALKAAADAKTLTVVCARLAEGSNSDQQGVLHAIGSAESLPAAAAAPLLALLPTRSAHVSGNVIRVIRKIQNPPRGVGPALRKHLKRVDPSEHNADWMAQEVYDTLAALGELTPADIPALVRLLANGNGPISERGAELLKPFGAAAVPALRERLAAAGATDWTLLYFLARLGPAAAEAVPGVLDELNSGDTDAVRNALHAVCQFGPVAAAAAPRLLDLLRHEERSIRQLARAALGALGAAAAPHFGRIVAWWRSDDCPDANEYAELFVALAPHVPEALPVLREFVRTGEVWRLARVVDAIAAFGPDAADAEPDLIALAGRAGAGLLASIATALGRIGVRSAEAVATLKWMAEGEDAAVREAATGALARLKS